MPDRILEIIIRILEGSATPDELVELLAELIAALGSMYFMVAVGSLLLFFLLYLFHGYIVNCIGNKANLPESKSWMCYVPIAREAYMTQITRQPGWYVLFLPGLLNFLFYVVATLILRAVFGTRNFYRHLLLLFLIWIAIYIASCIFRFFYYKQFYKDFGFNGNTAIVHILPTLNPSFPVCSTLRWVFFTLIAFKHDIAYRKQKATQWEATQAAGTIESFHGQSGQIPVSPAAPAFRQTVPMSAPMPAPVSGRKGYVTGVSGKYAGASFDIEDGMSIVFGRSHDANLVFDQFDTDISREHCSVRFNAASGMYELTDRSTNGTFGVSGDRYPKNQPVNIQPGTTIYLGKTKKHAFRLG